MPSRAEFLISRPLEVPVVTHEQNHIEVVHPEKLLPLTFLQHVEHWGFDVEETIFDIQPGYLATNFAHFLMYELQLQEVNQGIRRAEDVVKPSDYLQVMPAASHVRTLNPSMQEKEWDAFDATWHSYQIDTLAFLENKTGDARLVRESITNFVYSVHSNDARGESAANLLGIPIGEMWQKYGAFWEQLAPSPEEAWNITPYELKPGTVELLNHLVENGKQIHFITNAEYDRVAYMLETLREQGFDGSYSFTSCASLRPEVEGEKPRIALKPAPDGFYQIYTELSIEKDVQLEGKHPMLYIGNAYSDVLAAHAAEASFAFRVGEDTDQTGEAPAHYRTRTLSEIYTYLKDNAIFS